MIRSLRALTLGALAVSSFPTLAPGFVETQDRTAYEIPLPGGDLNANSRPSSATSARSASLEAELRAQHGGEWRIVAWNALTDTPSQVIGSGFETGVMLLDDEIAAAIARQEIAAHPGVFGRIGDGEIELSGVARGRGKLAVHFRQVHGGAPIIGAGAHLTFTESGRLFAMHSTLHRDVNVSTVPSLSAAAARSIAIAALPISGAIADAIDGEIVLRVLPVPSVPRVDHRLVWVVRVETESPLGMWVTHVDAHTGEIVYRYNDVHFLEYSGTATGDVQPDTYCNGSEPGPFAYVRVDVSGLPTTSADPNGDWNAGEGGSADTLVVSSLVSDYVDVDVDPSAGDDALIDGTISAGVPFAIEYDDTNSRADERDVFMAISDIHDFFETIDPGYGYSNTQIVANVGINSFCNAGWNGEINFFRAGNGCANTGEIQSIVHHEFGHGVQNDLLGGSQGSQGLGEGNSDVLANVMTQDSVVGRGLNLDCGGGARNSDNTLRYPGDVVGQPIHSAGRVIAGFHWDIMTGLQAELGVAAGTTEAASLWHFARKLEKPTGQQAQVLATFVADDDDGNLTNGTPHCDVINYGAFNHGFDTIACEIEITHERIDSRVTEGGVVVSADIVSFFSSLTAATVHYTKQNAGARGPSFIELPMAYAGGDTYEAVIPDLVHLDQVSYYVSATDAAENQATHPFLAPAEVHRFDIATIWHDQETDQLWSVDLEGTDDATTGVWERVDPIGTVAQPEDDHTSAGTTCWVTGQGSPGGGIGEADVDGGATSLYSPSYDLTGATIALARYWRWFSNDTGAAPGSESWEVAVRNDGGPWQIVETTFQPSQWEQIEDDLAARFGEALGVVRFRFRTQDPDPGSLVEAAVDDLAILADDGTAVAIGGTETSPPRTSYLAEARPNPFNPLTTFRFGLAEAGRVRLDLYDVSGRLVRTLVDERLKVGHHQVTWDGTGDSGRALGSGIYYARMDAGRVVEHRKLTLLR